MPQPLNRASLPPVKKQKTTNTGSHFKVCAGLTKKPAQTSFSFLHPAFGKWFTVGQHPLAS